MINLKNLIDFLPFEYKAQDTYKVNGKGILERVLEICGEHFEDYITKDIENILDPSHFDNNTYQASTVRLNFKCWFGNGNVQDHYSQINAAMWYISKRILLLRRKIR